MTTKDILETIGDAIAVLLVVLLAWLFLLATPDQYSAECELLQFEMEETETTFQPENN